MDFANCKIIEELYNSELITDVTTSPEYKKLINQYNDLFDTIEDKDLKNKLEKLEEMKNNLYSMTDKDIFKAGFSMAVKMLIEALSTNV